MDQFTISEIARFTGIKPHTLRIWEQRYNVVSPNRSEGNTRYYDNDQLRRLLNIVSLRDYEYSLSELCRMSDDELFALLKERQFEVDDDGINSVLVSQLISAGMSFDDLYFEKIFSHCLLRFGIKSTYTDILLPMLERLGLMWTTDNLPPAHEHFISHLVRQKLFTAIDALKPAEPDTSKWLLFLPENEFHDISLLFAWYLIGFSGQKVIYLGANLPFESLETAVHEVNPDCLLFFFIHYDLPKNAQEYLDKVQESFPDQKLFFSGNKKLARQLKTGEKTKWLKKIKSLEQQMNT